MTPRQNRLLRPAPLLHAGFVLTGIFTILLGPILPILAAHWSLVDSQAADFFAAQFIGTFGGVALSSVLIPRRGFRSSFVLGFFLMAMGAITLARGSWIAALVSVFLYGGGTGFLTAATNLWVGEANLDGKSGALSLINFSWTVGAVACPFLIEFFRGAHFMEFLAVLAIVSGAFALVFAAIPLGGSQPEDSSRKASAATTVALDRVAVSFGLLFFLYVGTENALGGWLATYSRRILAGTGNLWIVTPSFFWAGLLAGRAFAPAALKRVSEATIVRVGAVLGIAGTAILIQVTTLRGIFAGAFTAGLGCAAIFPVLMAWLIVHYEFDARLVAGRMLAIAELGAAAVPWLVGYLSVVSGTLQRGLAILFATFLGVFALATISPALRRSAKEARQKQDTDGSFAGR
ncbi:MAG: MFS transporter [Candidatus Acidiferrales bacterium]